MVVIQQGASGEMLVKGQKIPVRQEDKVPVCITATIPSGIFIYLKTAGRVKGSCSNGKYGHPWGSASWISHPTGYTYIRTSYWTS